mgnify:CR=1 FL=1
MGISTQYGVIQSTRTGDLDPFAVLYVMDQEHWGTKEITRQLMEESGLKGISGTSGDLRDVEAAADAGNDNARLAMETFFYGVKKQIGAYIAILGGLDVIAFTGGIGEKSTTARTQICLELGWLGIELDSKKNQNHLGEQRLPVLHIRLPHRRETHTRHRRYRPSSGKVRPARGHARQGAHDAPWSRCERVEHAVGDCCACGAHFSGGMCLEKNDKKSVVFSAILGYPPPVGRIDFSEQPRYIAGSVSVVVSHHRTQER